MQNCFAYRTCATVFLFVWHVMWAQRVERQAHPFWMWRHHPKIARLPLSSTPSSSSAVAAAASAIDNRLSPTKQTQIFVFFLPFFFFFHFFIHTSYHRGTFHRSVECKKSPTRCEAKKKKTYQFTLDLQTFSYCKIIKYSSIDFNSPRRVCVCDAWCLK